MQIPDTAVVVTTINPPTEATRLLAIGAREHGMRLIIVGDTASPSEYPLEGADFLSVEQQKEMPFELAVQAPTGHYARKNVGYLAAIGSGAEVIIETDDDNLPRLEFFAKRHLRPTVDLVDVQGWVNVYGFFGDDSTIWPRGLPLDAIRCPLPDITATGIPDLLCPIQQGLVDLDPDVDAIFRLVGRLPYQFRKRDPIALAPGSWAPFNSQNTTWFREAFALLYLPFHCSFRMTDIWRSFVAQRVGWANGWHVMFHSATVWQERNEHNLMSDFADEIPGYLHNRSIAEMLMSVDIKSGIEHLGDGLLTCYDRLIGLGLVEPQELALLQAWTVDFNRLR